MLAKRISSSFRSLSNRQKDARHDTCPPLADLPARTSAVTRWALRPTLGLALLAMGCTATPPPVAVPPPVAAAEPPPAPPAAPRRLALRWTFRADEAACRAVAAGPGAAVSITVTRNTVGLAARLTTPGAPVRPAGAAMQFQGAAGTWSAPLTQTGRRTAALAGGLNEDAVGRVLVMLSGGRLQVGRAGAGWPVLLLQASGAAGKLWFECVRRQLTG